MQLLPQECTSFGQCLDIIIRNQFGYFKIKDNIMMVFYIFLRYLLFVSVIIKMVRIFAQLIAILFSRGAERDAREEQPNDTASAAMKVFIIHSGNK